MADIAAADAVEVRGNRYEVDGDVAVWVGADLPDMGDTIVLIIRTVTGQDVYGNDVLAETQEAVTGCSVQPQLGQAASTEINGDREQVSTGLVAYVPLTARSFQVAALRRVRG